MIGLAFLGINSSLKTLLSENHGFWIDTTTGLLFPLYMTFAKLTTPFILNNFQPYLLVLVVIGPLFLMQISALLLHFWIKKYKTAIAIVRNEGKNNLAFLQFSCLGFGIFFLGISILCYILDIFTPFTCFGLSYHGLWHTFSATSMTYLKVADYVFRIIMRKCECHFAECNETKF